MEDSHGSEHEEGVNEASNSAGGSSEDQDDTEEKLPVDIVTNLTGNKTEEGVWDGVDQTDEETVPVLELGIGSGDLVDWIVSHLAESGVAIGVVKTLSLPLDHDTGHEGDEENKVGVGRLELFFVDFILSFWLVQEVLLVL